MENELSIIQKVVQSTLQTEMRSYSSALITTCSAVLSSKKVIFANVKSATVRKNWSRYCIVYDVLESDSEVLPDTVSDIPLEIDDRLEVRSDKL